MKDNPWQWSSFRSFVYVAGGFVLLLGLLVLIGWHGNIHQLLRISSSYPVMQYNTALSFFLCGLGLLTIPFQKYRISEVCGALVLVLGGLTLLEYIFHVDLGIDQLLMGYYINVESLHPGRMSPQTAICFFLVGLALVLSRAGSRSNTAYSFQSILGSIVLGFGLVSLGGYFSDLKTAYGWGGLPEMAIHTGIGFFVLGFGLMVRSMTRSESQSFLSGSEPTILIGITGLTISILSWQAFWAEEVALVKQLDRDYVSYTDEIFLVVGLIITGALMVGVGLLRKAGQPMPEIPGNRSPLPDSGQINSRFQIHFRSIVTLTVIALLIVASGFALSYQANLRREKKLLKGIAMSQARLIEAMAGFDAKFYRSESKGGVRDATLAQIYESKKNYKGFSKTSEFLLGEKQGNYIVFLLPHRAGKEGTPPPVEWNGKFSEPMRRALMGKSGVMEGLDYSGYRVLAAYEPLAGLHMGLVVKVNKSEVTGPFFRNGITAAVIVFLVLFLGALINIRGINPVLSGMSLVNERLQMSLKASGAGTFFYDAKTETIVWDQACYDIFGLEAGEFNGRTEDWVERVHPEDQEWIFKYFEKGILDPATSHRDAEYRIIHPNGQIRHVNTVIAYYRNAEHELVNISGLHFDVTERRGAAQELTESRELLQQIFDASPMGIAIVVQGVVRFVNPSGQDMLGLSVGSISTDIFVEPKDREEILKKMELEGQVVNREVQLYDANRDIRDYLISYFPIMYAGEQSILGWSVDITERKKAEEKLKLARDSAETRNQELTRLSQNLRAAKDEAEEATRAKSEFLANMSHEIRTPMNAVIGMAYLVQKTNLEPRQRDYIEKIEVSARNQLRIINNILDISRIEAGKVELEETDFNLDDVLDNVENLASLKLRVKKDLKMLHQVSPDVPRHLVGDSLRLDQILTNLVFNALKFTDEGEIIMSISALEVSESKAHLRFAISDSGIGMNAEQMEKLFHPFAQADTSITRRYGGTGLGLTICKRLVNLMGGGISCKSEEGKGSTFTFDAIFKLPSGFNGRSPAAIRKPAESLELETRALLEGKHILLAEDNEMNQEVAVDLLQMVGIRTRVVSDGQAAVHELQSGQFDAVLMDIQMPFMDGLAATRMIRENREFPQLPIIAMTAHAMDSDREKSLEAGMNTHITKPIDPSILYRTLVGQILGEDVAAELSESLNMTRDSSRSAPAIKGMETRQALSRVRGNLELYHKLLKSFVDSSESVGDIVSLKIKAGKKGDAQRELHTVKGVASNIGAGGVADRARNLELALKSGQEDLSELTLDFESEMAGTVKMIRAYLDSVAATGSSEEQSERAAPGEAMNLLSRLTELLSQNDTGVQDLLSKLKVITLPKALRVLLGELESLIDAWDFETGAERFATIWPPAPNYEEGELSELMSFLEKNDTDAYGKAMNMQKKLSNRPEPSAAAWVLVLEEVISLLDDWEFEAAYSLIGDFSGAETSE